MIPLDKEDAHRAYNEGKINLWEYTFIEQVRHQDDITQKQCDKILDIGHKMLPFKLIKTQMKTYRAPIDPYFGERYIHDEY